jgi:glutamate synthase domain-containing protein 2
MSWWLWVLVAIFAALALVAVYDIVQRRHAILRNYPIIGHLRYLLEGVGPELRQYIVTDNDADKPFSRDHRRWIYASAKHGDVYYGFGTDNDLESSPNYLIVRQVSFPLRAPTTGALGGPPDFALPCAKVLGGARRRAKAFRMRSSVNISSMSYGSLSRAAVEALNRGAALDGCLQGTGEGGISPYHRNGGDLVWQIGTGYFGCRDAEGRFSIDRFLDTLETTPTACAIEIKISQGAKPGLGGVLPAAKVSREVSAMRGVPFGEDCVSPPVHSAFHDADSLLDFAELLGQRSGLPIGIKSAVGHDDTFRGLARLMARDPDRGLDFITVDGGEGGTGAGPLAFTDHVALPFKLAFARVYRSFAEHGVADRLVFVGSGKLGIPQTALLAFAMGCDAVNVGREAMLAIGCIQAQRCHTGRCPSGVTTHSRWRTRGLDPALKAVRVASYLAQLRREILELSRACGAPHPALVTLDDFEVLGDHFDSRPAAAVFGYEDGWGMPSADDRAALAEWTSDPG